MKAPPKIGNTYYSFCLLKTLVRHELMREVIMACILHVGALRANGLLARNRTGGIRKPISISSSAICLRDGSGWARTPNVWAFKMGSQCVGRTGRRRQHFLLCKHGRGCGTTRSHQPNSLLSQRQMVLLKGQPRNKGLSKWLSFLGSVKALNPNLFSRVLACTCRLWVWVQICADFILGATAEKMKCNHQQAWRTGSTSFWEDSDKFMIHENLDSSFSIKKTRSWNSYSEWAGLD